MPLELGAFALLTLIWGSTFLAIRVSNAEGYEPFSAVVVRLALAAMVLLAAARALRLRFPRGREGAIVLGAGLLMFGVNFGLLYWGELSVTSGTAAVLWGTYPLLMTLGAARLFADEPLTLRGIGGALVALAGLAVVFASHLSLDAPLAGFGAVLGGILAAALASLAVKRWAHGVHPLVYNAVGCAGGAALLAPFAWVLGDGFALPPTSAAWGSLAFLLVAGSIVAFNVWAWLIHRWPATRLSYQTVLSPLIAVALGVLVLREPLQPQFLAGAALVLAGTYLAVRRPAGRPAPPAPAATPEG